MDEKRGTGFISSGYNDYSEANMSEKMVWAKMWVLTHSGLIVAIAFVAIALAAAVFAPTLGLAGKRPKP